MNRQQRRAAARKTKKTPAGLARAGRQLDTAVQALRKIEGLEGSVKTLEGLQTEIAGAQALMQAAVSDLETLNAEVKLQREVLIRLLPHILGVEITDEKKDWTELRDVEKQIRALALTTPALATPRAETTDGDT